MEVSESKEDRLAGSVGRSECMSVYLFSWTGKRSRQSQAAAAAGVAAEEAAQGGGGAWGAANSRPEPPLAARLQTGAAAVRPAASAVEGTRGQTLARPSVGEASPGPALEARQAAWLQVLGRVAWLLLREELRQRGGAWRQAAPQLDVAVSLGACQRGVEGCLGVRRRDEAALPAAACPWGGAGPQAGLPWAVAGHRAVAGRQAWAGAAASWAAWGRLAQAVAALLGAS